MTQQAHKEAGIVFRMLNPFEKRVPHPQFLNFYGENDPNQQVIGKLWQMLIYAPLFFGTGYSARKVFGRSSEEYRKAAKVTRSSVMLPGKAPIADAGVPSPSPVEVAKVLAEGNRPLQLEGKTATEDPKGGANTHGNKNTGWLATLLPGFFGRPDSPSRPVGAMDYLAEYTSVAAPMATAFGMFMLGSKLARKQDSAAAKRRAEATLAAEEAEYDRILSERLYPIKDAAEGMVYGDPPAPENFDISNTVGKLALSTKAIPYLGLAQVALLGAAYVGAKQYSDANSEDRKKARERKKALEARAVRRYVPKLTLPAEIQEEVDADHRARLHGPTPDLT